MPLENLFKKYSTRAYEFQKLKVFSLFRNETSFIDLFVARIQLLLILLLNSEYLHSPCD